MAILTTLLPPSRPARPTRIRFGHLYTPRVSSDLVEILTFRRYARTTHILVELLAVALLALYRYQRLPQPSVVFR